MGHSTKQITSYKDYKEGAQYFAPTPSVDGSLRQGVAGYALKSPSAASLNSRYPEEPWLDEFKKIRPIKGSPI